MLLSVFTLVWWLSLFLLTSLFCLLAIHHQSSRSISSSFSELFNSGYSPQKCSSVATAHRIVRLWLQPTELFDGGYSPQNCSTVATAHRTVQLWLQPTELFDGGYSPQKCLTVATAHRTVQLWLQPTELFNCGYSPWNCLTVATAHRTVQWRQPTELFDCGYSPQNCSVATAHSLSHFSVTNNSSWFSSYQFFYTQASVHNSVVGWVLGTPSANGIQHLQVIVATGLWAGQMGLNYWHSQRFLGVLSKVNKTGCSVHIT
jgi:hypothetical protein